MKKIIAMLLLLSLLLAGCGGGEAIEPPVSTEGTESEVIETEDAGVDYTTYANKVRVLCYNIYYKDVDRRAANIQDLILKNDPDILLLQEASAGFLSAANSVLSGYEYFGYCNKCRFSIPAFSGGSSHHLLSSSLFIVASEKRYLMTLAGTPTAIA
jgi:hypothetical protein